MEELKILSSYERIYLKNVKFMFKISKSLAPEYVNEMFHSKPLNNTIQFLRSFTTIKYVLPMPHTELLSRVYFTLTHWFGLIFRQIETIDSFHKTVLNGRKWFNPQYIKAYIYEG